MAFANTRSGPHQLTNSAATLLTVGVGTTFVIQSIIVTNTDTVARTYTLSIGADAAGVRLFSAVSIAANTTVIHTVHIPLDATEIIQGYADATTKVNVTFGGFTVS